MYSSCQHHPAEVEIHVFYTVLIHMYTCRSGGQHNTKERKRERKRPCQHTLLLSSHGQPSGSNVFLPPAAPGSWHYEPGEASLLPAKTAYQH